MRMQKKSLGLLIVCVFLLVGMVGCVAGLQTFFGEDRNPVSRMSVVKDSPVTRLEINASIVAADPIRGLPSKRRGLQDIADFCAQRRHCERLDQHRLAVGSGA